MPSERTAPRGVVQVVAQLTVPPLRVIRSILHSGRGSVGTALSGSTQLVWLALTPPPDCGWVPGGGCGVAGACSCEVNSHLPGLTVSAARAGAKDIAAIRAIAAT